MSMDFENLEKDKDLHSFSKCLIYVFIGIASIISIWFTIVAFIGGTLPLFGITLRGGIISGLFWMFVIDPIVLTIIYWISMVVVLPIQLIISWLGENSIDE
jgi:hypothetical protein